MIVPDLLTQSKMKSFYDWIALNGKSVKLTSFSFSTIANEYQSSKSVYDGFCNLWYLLYNEYLSLYDTVTETTTKNITLPALASDDADPTVVEISISSNEMPKYCFIVSESVYPTNGLSGLKKSTDSDSVSSSTSTSTNLNQTRTFTTHYENITSSDITTEFTYSITYVATIYDASSSSISSSFFSSFSDILKYPYKNMRKYFVRDYIPDLTTNNYKDEDNIETQMDLVDSSFSDDEKSYMDDNEFYVTETGSETTKKYSKFFCRINNDEAPIYESSTKLKKASDDLNKTSEDSDYDNIWNILNKIYNSTIH